MTETTEAAVTQGAMIAVPLETLFLATMILTQVVHELNDQDAAFAMEAALKGEDPEADECLCSKHLYLMEVLEGIGAAMDADKAATPAGQEISRVSPEFEQRLKDLVDRRQAQSLSRSFAGISGGDTVSN